MKLSLFAIAGVVSLVSAQAAPNLPQCGTNVMIQAVSSSGCAFTDAACICKNQAILNAAKSGLPKACSAPADQKVFADFFNGQCTGQPGFPIVIGKSDTAPKAGGADGSSSGSSSGATPSNAVSSGAPKPSSAGAAGSKSTSDGKVTQVSVGVLAAAAAIALFGLS